MKIAEVLDIRNLQHKLLTITIECEEGATPARYEQTRSSWKLSPARANEADYVFSVTRGIVKAIYKTDSKGWYADALREKRYLFEGTEVTDPEITSLYLGKMIERKKGQANPIKYLYGANNKKDDTMNTSDEMKKITIQDIVTENIKNGVSQIILTGAPGTGKTYTAKSVADAFNTVKGKAEQDILTGFVQFHPSYDYTDFVEGLRPVSDGDNVSFKKLDGIFKKFCRNVVAKNDESTKYFFIIDEINRADLANVLGELMFCLESDKRGENNKVQTQYSNVPTWDIEKNSNLDDDCFKDGFYIPKNVVIIGTMNDIDRSVESFDFALRRRFTWIDVEVTEDLLQSALSPEHFKLDEYIIDKLISRILALNNVIKTKGKEFGLNKHYAVSQGYFKDVPAKQRKDINELCGYVWQYRLKNLLEEYVRGESQSKIDGFIADCEAAFLANAPIQGKIPNEQASESTQQGE